MREQTLDLQGRRSEQRADIDALEVLAESLDDNGRRALVALRRSEIALLTADYLAQMTAAQTAMGLAARAGDHALRLRAQRRLASAMAHLGDYEAAQAMAQQGLAEARERGLRLNVLRFSIPCRSSPAIRTI